MIVEYENAVRDWKRVFLYRNCKNDIHRSWHSQLINLEKSYENIQERAHSLGLAIERKFKLANDELSDYLNAVIEHEKKVLMQKKKESGTLGLKEFLDEYRGAS